MGMGLLGTGTNPGGHNSDIQGVHCSNMHKNTITHSTWDIQFFHHHELTCLMHNMDQVSHLFAASG